MAASDARAAENMGAPRPRVLAVGLTGEEIELIRPLAGSLRTAARLFEVHPEEHDVLIHTSADFNDGSDFPRRIAFADAVESETERHNYYALHAMGGGGFAPESPTMSTTQFRPASDFEIPEDARGLGLETLIGRSCVPDSGANYTGFRAPVYPRRTETPLLVERLNQPLTLAAILDRRLDVEENHGGPIDSAFWLPDIARGELTAWVRAAFDYWRPDAPQTFPESAEWRQSDEWGTPSEVEARRSLRKFDIDEEQRQAAAAAARTILVSTLTATESDGESWRALISETGDELVAAVRGAFELLGFSVVDADALEQHKGKKREDLRVSDGDWTALVEVKGYTGAAKSNDLQQLSGAATHFAIEERRAPDALWYVVNAYREVDPAQRELPLASREDDLQAFGDDQSGCLIDTRDLFTLRQRVALGELDGATAREALKSARVRFTAASLTT